MSVRKPIRFVCQTVLKMKPEAITSRILEVENWSDFRGYGPLPGIRQAVFLKRTANVTGSSIAVTNTDGSTHVEEITRWEPEKRIEMRLHQFSKPLSRLATHFDETWEFDAGENGTQVTRTFALYSQSGLMKPVLWLISILLKRAVERHMRQIA